MPPRPFLSPYSIGLDICHIARIRRILTSPKLRSNDAQLTRFLSRFLSWREQNEFHARFRRYWSDGDKFVNLGSHYLAGRWAAKEATIKAFQWRPLGFLEIHIAAKADGRGVDAVVLDVPATAARESTTAASPSATLTTTTAKCDAIDLDLATDGLQDLQGQIVQVSITHDAEYAAAVCLAVREEVGRVS